MAILALAAGTVSSSWEVHPVAAGLSDASPTAGCPLSHEDKPLAADQVMEYVYGTELWAEPDVSMADREGIKAGLGAIQSYLQMNIGGLLPSGVCLDVRAVTEGAVGTARTEGQTILILTTPTGWPDSPPWRLSQVIAHEYVHAWQALVGGPGLSDSAVWLLEGMADWIAWRAMVDAEIVSSGEAEAVAAMPGGPFVPELSLLETQKGWGQALGPYAVSFQAVRLLITGQKPGALGLYLSGIARGLAWTDAFYQVFGRSPTDFYRLFDLAGQTPR